MNTEVETVKITGDAVTICTSLGYTYIQDIYGISHIEQCNCAGYSDEKGKEYPAEFMIDVWLTVEDKSSGFHIVRFKCADVDESNHVMAALVAALEHHNVTLRKDRPRIPRIRPA